MIRRGCDVDFKSQFLMTPLLWSASRGYQEVVKELLDSRSSVKNTDLFGNSSLIWSCKKGYFEISKLLIKFGSEINHIGFKGCTPLICAVKSQNIDLIDLLLSMGADPNIIDLQGFSALMHAVQKEKFSVVETLLKYGSYVNISNKNGITPLMLSSKKGHLQIVELLLSKYADINSSDSEGMNALLYTTQEGHYKIVEILIKHGAKLESYNKSHMNPLLISVSKGFTKCVRVLIRNGANCFAQDAYGRTPLHLASLSKNINICRLILNCVNDYSILFTPDNVGKTPYSIDSFNSDRILCCLFREKLLRENLNILNKNNDLAEIVALTQIITYKYLDENLFISVLNKSSNSFSEICSLIKDEIQEHNIEKKNGFIKLQKINNTFENINARTLSSITASPTNMKIKSIQRQRINNVIIFIIFSLSIFLFLWYCNIDVTHCSIIIILFVILVFIVNFTAQRWCIRFKIAFKNSKMMFYFRNFILILKIMLLEQPMTSEQSLYDVSPIIINFKFNKNNENVINISDFLKTMINDYEKENYSIPFRFHAKFINNGSSMNHRTKQVFRKQLKFFSSITTLIVIYILTISSILMIRPFTNFIQFSIIWHYSY